MGNAFAAEEKTLETPAPQRAQPPASRRAPAARAPRPVSSRPVSGQSGQSLDRSFAGGSEQYGSGQRPGAEKFFTRQSPASRRAPAPRPVSSRPGVGPSGQSSQQPAAEASTVIEISEANTFVPTSDPAFETSEMWTKVGTNRSTSFNSQVKRETSRDISDALLRFMVNDVLKPDHAAQLITYLNRDTSVAHTPNNIIGLIHHFVNTLPPRDAQYAGNKMTAKLAEWSAPNQSHGGYPSAPQFVAYDAGFSAGIQRGRDANEMFAQEEQTSAPYGEKLWTHSDSLYSTLTTTAVPRDSTPLPRSGPGLTYGVGQTCFDGGAPCSDNGYNIFTSRPLLSQG